MFNYVYTWLYSWLFADGLGALTQQGAEFTVILFSLFVIAMGVFIISLPFIWLFRLILNR